MSLVQPGDIFKHLHLFQHTSQWRNESVSISTCDINTSSIVIGIKSVNDFGNNIYVDNFSITKLDTKQENARSAFHKQTI